MGRPLVSDGILPGNSHPVTGNYLASQLRVQRHWVKGSKRLTALVRLLQLAWESARPLGLEQGRQGWGSTLSWGQEAGASSKQTKGIHPQATTAHTRREAKGPTHSWSVWVRPTTGLSTSQEHTRNDIEDLHSLRLMGLLCEVHSRPGRGESSFSPASLSETIQVCLSFIIMT